MFQEFENESMNCEAIEIGSELRNETPPTYEKKFSMIRDNIWEAVNNYASMTHERETLNDVRDSFVRRLASDNIEAKADLRRLFRKSPAWSESLDAIVINGNRTHDPDPERLRDLLYILLFKNSPLSEFHVRLSCLIDDWATEGFNDRIGNSLNEFDPSFRNVYVPGRKPSRVLRNLLCALGRWDDTRGCECQKLFARAADEMSSRKLDFKLIVSLNPAHFLTMSNPLHDVRGATLKSCHSLDRTDYSYNCGCSGYARDEISMIVFTCEDPMDPISRNTRKTSRQIFAYEPGSSVLLQSRMYNTSGGTYGAQEESKLYRDLIQRELSFLEGADNLWKTARYYNQHHIDFNEADGFGGYADWPHSDFDAHVSIRSDYDEDYGKTSFTIGAPGLCICCGKETSDGLYCDDCNNAARCDECGERYDADELYFVHDYYGNGTYVCESCRDEYYHYCVTCNEYHHRHNGAWVRDDVWVCDSCCESEWSRCDDCDEWYENSDLYHVLTQYGYYADVCESCLEDNYVRCEHCGEYVHRNLIRDLDDTWCCPDCAARIEREMAKEASEIVELPEQNADVA